MKRLLLVAALLEAATGLALISDPALVIRLLLGEAGVGIGLALGHLAGFALLALGIACWPGLRTPTGLAPACGAMLTYNMLTTALLIELGIGDEFVGPLLWPAAALHAVLTLLLVGAWCTGRATSKII